MALRALAEDIEDEARPVHDVAAEEALEVTLLCRAQRVVEDDDLGVFLVRGDLHLLRLARADEQRCVRPGTFASDCTHRFGAGSRSQQRQFTQAFLKIVFAEIDRNQNGACRLRVGGGMRCQAGK